MTRRTRATAFTLLAAVLLAFLAYRLGVFEALRDPAHARAVLGTGPEAAVAFVLVVTVLAVIGVPPILFLVPATLWFSRPVVFGLGMSVGELGGCLGVFLARTVGRDYVATRIPARIRKWDERLAKRGLLAVVLMRVAFFVLPPASWLLGLSKVRTWHVVVGTAIGILPWAWACAYVGGSFLSWLGAQPPWVWAIAALAVLAAVVVLRGRDDGDDA